MESDQINFEVHPFPTLDRIKEVAERFVGFLSPQHVEMCLTNYPKHPERRGAAEMLDAHLYDQRAA